MEEEEEEEEDEEEEEEEEFLISLYSALGRERWGPWASQLWGVGGWVGGLG